MAIIQFQGYARNPETGVGVGGARVRAYPVNQDGTKNLSVFVETSTASVTGKWSLSVNTDVYPSPTGMYAIEIYNPADGTVRWIEPDIKMQIAHFVGPHGEAPIADGSVTANKLATNSVTDDKVGPRTISDTSAPSGNSGVLTTLLGGLANRIKAITGESSWRSNPAVTLKQLVSGTLISGLNADMLDGRHASEFALANHTHSGSGQVTPHTHPGSDITSAVATANNALALNGISADGYLRWSGGRTHVTNWGSGVRIVAGAQVINTNSNGESTTTINFPVSFPNEVLLIMCSAASSSTYRGSVVPLAGSATRSGFRVRLETNQQLSGILINYIAFGR